VAVHCLRCLSAWRLRSAVSLLVGHVQLYMACTASVQDCCVMQCLVVFPTLCGCHCLLDLVTWLLRGALSSGLWHMQWYVRCLRGLGTGPCEVRCLYDFDRLQCPPYAACTASIQGCYVGHCPDDFDQFAVIFHCLHGCGTWLSRGTLSPGLRHMQRYIACSALLQIQDYCTVHCLNDFDRVQ
jgi:hypothetical protein